jgi:hypothetical protein
MIFFTFFFARHVVGKWGVRIEDRGLRIEDRGLRIEDRGLRIEGLFVDCGHVQVAYCRSQHETIVLPS